MPFMEIKMKQFMNHTLLPKLAVNA